MVLAFSRTSEVLGVKDETQKHKSFLRYQFQGFLGQTKGNNEHHNFHTSFIISLYNFALFFQKIFYFFWQKSKVGYHQKQTLRSGGLFAISIVLVDAFSNLILISYLVFSKKKKKNSVEFFNVNIELDKKRHCFSFYSLHQKLKNLKLIL